MTLEPVSRKRLRVSRVVLAVCLVASLSRLAAASTVPGRDGSANLTIRVESVSPKGGTLRIALFDISTYAGHKQPPLTSADVPAVSPETVTTLTNLRPGTYAVKMFQDFYGTHKFVANRWGVPQEPFGFSNDAIPLLDQPSFNAVKFEVLRGPNSITVHLRAMP